MRDQAGAVLCAVLLAAGLAACTSGGSEAGSTTPTGSTVATVGSPTVEPSPSASPLAPIGAPSSGAVSLDVAEFRSDSVQCVIRDEGVECQLQTEPTYEVPAELLENGPPCTVVWLETAATEGVLGCAGDMLSETVGLTDVLPAGTAVVHGGFTCTLLQVGATCENEVGGLVSITPEEYTLSR